MTADLGLAAAIAVAMLGAYLVAFLIARIGPHWMIPLLPAAAVAGTGSAVRCGDGSCVLVITLLPL